MVWRFSLCSKCQKGIDFFTSYKYITVSKLNLGFKIRYHDIIDHTQCFHKLPVQEFKQSCLVPANIKYSAGLFTHTRKITTFPCPHFLLDPCHFLFVSVSAVLFWRQNESQKRELRIERVQQKEYNVWKNLLSLLKEDRPLYYDKLSLERWADAAPQQLVRTNMLSLY